ncbi:MAG: hypothetical protein ACRCSL_16585 [Microbacterium sp.]
MTERIGRCDDCGHPYRVYRWLGSLPLRAAVCPMHGTPLVRTTYPRDLDRVVMLAHPPRSATGGSTSAKRPRDATWRSLGDL